VLLIHFHFHRQGPRSRKAAPAAVELCPSAETPTPKEVVCDSFFTLNSEYKSSVCLSSLVYSTLQFLCGSDYNAAASGPLLSFGLLFASAFSFLLMPGEPINQVISFFKGLVVEPCAVSFFSNRGLTKKVF
jgi:hypothetical protein